MKIAILEPAPRPRSDPQTQGKPDEARGASSLRPAALAATLALTACGGGGGDGGASAASAGGTSTVTSGTGSEDGGSQAPPVAAPSPAPPAAPAITNSDAARFLAQAGFAANAADIASVQLTGYSAWLDKQFALASSPTTNFQWLMNAGYGAAGNSSNLYGWSGIDNTLWRTLMSSPDPLRQRVVLAYSEIFVIALQGLPVAWPTFLVASYVDMLSTNAFGTFRALIEGVALSCGMGVYLDMLGSEKANSTGRMPDENFAREFMQLMTIGLVQLNLDGSPVLDASGNPVPTYSQTDITNLAAVFTGWTYNGQSNTDPSYVLSPMVNVASNFSTGPKQVLNVAIPASADGPGAMKIALDTLANHPNVGPFIGRQLIQRLVSSNPSPAYVQRVATTFNDNGSGVRGDMKAVIKAILMDTEARTLSTAASAGRLREPIMRFIQWGRTFGVTSPTNLWNVGYTYDPGSQLGQSPLRSPSVFNFFRPGYVPPNSTLGTNHVTAPEFQLCNETTVAGYLNYMQQVIANGMGEVKPDYTAQIALASDASTLVANINLLMAAGGLGTATLATISSAVASIDASTAAGKLNRVQAAILLVMACPEYQIQK